MKSQLIAIVAAVVLVGCGSSTTQPLNKFWFEYTGQQEPGLRLWERDDNGIWAETYPSGHQSKFQEEGRDKVDGFVGDYVIKLSGDIEKTGTQDGGFRVFIPDYQKGETFLYFSQKSSEGWTVWRKSNYSIKVLTTRDGEKVEDMPPKAKPANPEADRALLYALREFQHSKTISPKKIRKAIADGADVNAMNTYGFGSRTPLDWAIRIQHGALEAFFRKHGGKTGDELSIHIAAELGYLKAVKQHLAGGADVNAKTNTGSTPLHNGARAGHKEMVELLIAEGADVNAKDVGGGTPLDYAIKRKRTEIADLLRKHGGKTGEEL